MSRPLLVNQYAIDDHGTEMTTWKCPLRPRCTKGSHTGPPGSGNALVAMQEAWHQQQHDVPASSDTTQETKP